MYRYIIYRYIYRYLHIVTVYPVSYKFGNNIWTNIPHVSINLKPIYCCDFKIYLEKKLDGSTYHLYCCGLYIHVLYLYT